MYRKTPDNQLSFENFYLPFGSKLNDSVQNFSHI